MIFHSLLLPANEVWGKVIFLHLSVILFTGGGGYMGGTPTNNNRFLRHTQQFVLMKSSKRHQLIVIKCKAKTSSFKIDKTLMKQ